MSGTSITFRPFIELTGVYDTGLSGVGVVDNKGNLADDATEGVELVAGISGSHRWRHTTMGLDYRGSYRHYTQNSYYDGTDQAINLGLTHQLSRHTSFALRESAGSTSRDFGTVGLQQAVPFDPSNSYIPRTDFFDNRTLYLSSHGDLTYQRNARLSFNLGGDYFTVHRRSSALYGTTGEGARADVQYRIGRYTTIGVNYMFSRYSFSKGFGDTTMNSAVGSYSVRLSRTVELSAYAGIIRYETSYIVAAPITDPVIAAILGRSYTAINTHNIDTMPNVGGRISRTFHNGVVDLNGSRSVTPGNGLFLTSASTNITASVNYSGVRRWSLSAHVSAIMNDAKSNVQGSYNGYSAGGSVSRRLSRSLNFVAGVDARRYKSPDFTLYNRTIYRATFGFGWAPGDVPLRVW